MRTEAVNLVRGMVKAAGNQVAACSPAGFPEKAKDEIPEVLREALAPMAEQIRELSGRIWECERTIETVARE